MIGSSLLHAEKNNCPVVRCPTKRVLDGEKRELTVADLTKDMKSLASGLDRAGAVRLPR